MRTFLESTHPEILVLLGRSAELAFTPLLADYPYAQTVHIGRETYHDPTKINYLYAGRTRLLQKFIPWINQNWDTTLKPVVESLGSLLAENSNAKYIALDDVVQSGGTFLVTAAVVARLLSERGIPDIIFSSPNYELARSTNLVADIIYSAQNKKTKTPATEPVHIELQTISSLSNWRYEVVRVTFSSFLKSVPEEDFHNWERLLGELARGSFETEEGTNVPLVSFMQVEELARRHKVDIHILVSQYNPDEVMEIHRKLHLLLFQVLFSMPNGGIDGNIFFA